MIETTLRDWFAVIAVASIMGLIRIFRRSRRKSIKDPPEGTPYSIYTTEFDQVLEATGLSYKLVSISPDFEKGFLERNPSEWEQAVVQAETIFAGLNKPKPSTLSERDHASNTAVLLLVDQSGSMKGQPMAYTAAGLRKLTNILQECGIKSEVIGFTTAGWHGGFVRQKWIEKGRPPRPGRLCALLHIIYKSFDDAELSEPAWREMSNPDMLRENVDGEAIEFAEARLLERPETNRVLLVISDGAAVDDSTLTQNGPSFLYRHATETISRVETDGKIALCAIGVNYRVNEWYQNSAVVSDGDGLIEAAIALIEKSLLKSG